MMRTRLLYLRCIPVLAIALLAVMAAGAGHADEANLLYAVGPADTDPGLEGGPFGWQPYNTTRRYTSNAWLWLGFELPDVGAEGVVSLRASKTGQPLFEYGGYYGTTAVRYDSEGTRTTLAFPPATENVVEKLTPVSPYTQQIRFKVGPNTSFVYFKLYVSAARFSNTYVYGADCSVIYTPTAAAPTVSGVDPSEGPDTEVVPVTITGTGFDAAATARLEKQGESDIVGQSVAVAGATEMSCEFDLTGAALGLWDVVVENPGGLSGSLPDGFEVVAGDISPPDVMGCSISAVHGGGVGELITPIGLTMVEPRMIAVDCLLVEFSEAMDAATVTPDAISLVGAVSGDQSGLVSSVALENGGTVARVNLSGLLPEPDRYTLTIADTVCDAAGNELPQPHVLGLPVLHGDANGNGTVDTGDMLAVMSRAGAPVTLDSCRFDINGNGTIDVGDALAVRARFLHQLPAAP